MIDLGTLFPNRTYIKHLCIRQFSPEKFVFVIYFSEAYELLNVNLNVYYFLSKLTELCTWNNKLLLGFPKNKKIEDKSIAVQVGKVLPH